MNPYLHANFSMETLIIIYFLLVFYLRASGWIEQVCPDNTPVTQNIHPVAENSWDWFGFFIWKEIKA